MYILLFAMQLSFRLDAQIRAFVEILKNPIIPLSSPGTENTRVKVYKPQASFEENFSFNNEEEETSKEEEDTQVEIVCFVF